MYVRPTLLAKAIQPFSIDILILEKQWQSFGKY